MPLSNARCRCPANGSDYSEVPTRTVAQHLRRPWNWQPSAHRWFFCDDPACDVVYFGDDSSVILKSELRTVVGCKEGGADAPLCYCYGVTRAEAEADPAIHEFVLEQTRQGNCACVTRNPSGRCCLREFVADDAEE